MKTYRETVEVDRCNHLLALVQAFIDGKRAVPGHILTELSRYQHIWKKRKGLPPIIAKSCATLRSVRDNQDFAEKLDGNAPSR